MIVNASSSGSYTLSKTLDSNVRLPSFSTLKLLTKASTPPNSLVDQFDPELWRQAPSTRPPTPPSHADWSLPPITSLLMSVPSPLSQTLTPATSPTTASFASKPTCRHLQPARQPWPGTYCPDALQHEGANSRSFSVPDIQAITRSPFRSSSVPDIWECCPLSIGPCRTQPRRNSRQEPYSRPTESASSKKTTRRVKKDKSPAHGEVESEDEPSFRNNTKYTDEQNHFIIYHHDDLEWAWKDIEEAYMRRWPKQGKEQPGRTEGALQCAFYRTNSVIPALERGSDLLVLGPARGFIQGKPAKLERGNSKKEVPRDSYELYQVYDNVPHLLEEVKVRASDVARKLCLRYPEAMLGYEWVKPEDKLTAQMIAAKRSIQRQQWRERYPLEIYKNGTYLHKWLAAPHASAGPHTFEPRFYQYHSAPSSASTSASFTEHIINIPLRFHHSR